MEEAAACPVYSAGRMDGATPSHPPRLPRAQLGPQQEVCLGENSRGRSPPDPALRSPPMAPALTLCVTHPHGFGYQ